MNRKQLIRKEVRGLDSLASAFCSRVEKTLTRIRKENTTLYLSLPDRHRLLKLKVWTVKYQVSLEFILKNLLPIWEGFVRRRNYSIKRSGLNVRVSTLVGKKSERLLVSLIQREYPDNSHKDLLLSRERNRIIREYIDKPNKTTDGIASSSDKKQSLFDFSTPGKYVRYYRKRINMRTRKVEILSSKMQEKPYRGNPFL